MDWVAKLLAQIIGWSIVIILGAGVMLAALVSLFLKPKE